MFKQYFYNYYNIDNNLYFEEIKNNIIKILVPNDDLSYFTYNLEYEIANDEIIIYCDYEYDELCKVSINCKLSQNFNINEIKFSNEIGDIFVENIQRDIIEIMKIACQQ